jgi:hypothetical protein
LPSPVGHILAGTAVYLVATTREPRSRVALMVTLLGSILPDFDFLPGILIGEPAVFHHGISHSSTFAVVFGVLIFFFLRRFKEVTTAARTAVVAALAYTSHVILDLVSVSEGARGIPILWPLSNERFAINLNLFGHFHHDGLNDGIWSVVGWDNVPALLSELFVVGIPVLFLLWKEKRNPKRAKAVSPQRTVG